MSCFHFECSLQKCFAKKRRKKNKHCFCMRPEYRNFNFVQNPFCKLILSSDTHLPFLSFYQNISIYFLCNHKQTWEQVKACGWINRSILYLLCDHHQWVAVLRQQVEQTEELKAVPLRQQQPLRRHVEVLLHGHHPAQVVKSFFVEHSLFHLEVQKHVIKCVSSKSNMKLNMLCLQKYYSY